VHVVFVSHLARPAAEEAAALADKLGTAVYETRLALSAPQPAILLYAAERERAADVVGVLRSRGHGAHAFDDESFTASEHMGRLDDFRLDADGARRTSDGELLPYGDVFAILRAMHATTGERVRSQVDVAVKTSMLPRMESREFVTKVYEREHVAYFFRRSGERPWILRERHASYTGLGPERVSIANANFVRTIERIRTASPMAVYDDRLIRRHVEERHAPNSKLRSSSDGMDLLAHLLAMAIASQGGSPYR
jgi:hypothetical protein